MPNIHDRSWFWLRVVTWDLSVELARGLFKMIRGQSVSYTTYNWKHCRKFNSKLLIFFHYLYATKCWHWTLCHSHSLSKKHIVINTHCPQYFWGRRGSAYRLRTQFNGRNGFSSIGSVPPMAHLGSLSITIHPLFHFLWIDCLLICKIFSFRWKFPFSPRTLFNYFLVFSTNSKDVPLSQCPGAITRYNDDLARTSGGEAQHFWIPRRTR